MSKHAKHAAPRAARTGRSSTRPASSGTDASGATAGRHRSAPQRGPLTAAPRKALGTSVLLGSVAVAATGTTVAGGVLSSSSAGPATPAAASLAAAAPVATADPERAAEAAATSLERAPQLSRSADRRDDTDPVKEAALSDTQADGPAQTGEQDLSDGDPRDVARVLLAEFGFSSDQFGCLDSLYIRESNWNPRADNPSSSAYGIPQALPGSKMASAGSDWATNPVTQIRWGLGYIRDRYGSPCGAWGHSQSHGWY